MTAHSRRTRNWMSRVASNCILKGAFILATMVLQAASNYDELPDPEFLPGTHNITVREGADVQLPCAVRNLGTKKVAWRLIQTTDRFLTIGKMTWSEDENISLDHSRSRLDRDISVWNLQIRHVRPRDAGLYECQVTASAGLARLIQLNVVGPPITKEVISITGKKYVDLGEKIELTCNASGGKVIPDEIDWFKGGDKINSGEDKYKHVLILKSQFISSNSFTSTLVINHSKLSDSGNYICRSSRNDIANLLVTVLHAASANTRRGTNPGPMNHDRQTEERDNYPNNFSSSIRAPVHTSILSLTLCVLSILARLSTPTSSS